MGEFLMTTNGKRKAEFQEITRIPYLGLHEQIKIDDSSSQRIPKLIIFDILPRIHIPYLPTPIISEILSRVEIKTLITSRLVCKSWKDLISTRRFAELHLSRSPTKCLMECVRGKSEPLFNLFNLEYPFDILNKLNFVKSVNLPSAAEFFNSINGLILLYTYGTDYFTFLVCNPVLKEYITLPRTPGFERNFPINTLGFCRRTNKYKVLVCAYNRYSMIYTLGEGSWRNIETPFTSCFQGYYSYDAFLNGSVHWLGHKGYFICKFDFETEQFGNFDKPSGLTWNGMSNESDITIGVINGNLSVCNFSFEVGYNYNIWVMKEYGAKDSWTKDFVIPNVLNNVPNKDLSDLGEDYYIYQHIVVTSNGAFLIIFKYGVLQIYDTSSQEIVYENQIYGANTNFEATAYTPSLISLKDAAKGETVEVL